MNWQRTASRWLTGLVLLRLAPTAAASTESTAHDDEVATCLESHAKSQTEWDEDLLGARQLLRQCTKDVCPQPVRRDCLTWLEQVEISIPTVMVYAVLGADASFPDELWIDGDPVPVTEVGRPIELNPGKHRFRARKIVGGEAVEAETEVLILSSARQQPVRVELRTASSSSESQTQGADPQRTGATRSGGQGADRRNLRIAGYTMLGLTAALGAVALGTGITGIQAHSDAMTTCAPYCDDDLARSVQTRLLVADITTAVAAATLVTSVVLLVVGRKKRKGSRDLALRF